MCKSGRGRYTDELVFGQSVVVSRPAGNGRSIDAQCRDRTRHRETVDGLESWNLLPAETQDGARLVASEAHELSPSSNWGDEIERSGGLELNEALALDVAWIGDVEGRQMRSIVLFD